MPYVLSLAVLIAMVYGGWTWWRVRQFEIAKADAIPASAVGPPLKEFELTERSGKPFRSADMRGRVWVASYFFTTCPGQCLRLNANIQVLSKMTDLKDVTWVSITCDPDTDTIEALRAYADRWQADPERWLFCRADLEYIQRVAKGMKVFLSLKGHQDDAIVIDKAGNIRGMYDATSEIQCKRMHAKLLECLEEKAPHDFAAGDANEREIELTILLAAHPIVHVNASLNALATVLLLVGLFFIKRGRVDAHKWTMLAAFAVSTVFLACYLWYHLQVGSVRFTHPGAVRYVYLTILASHVLLAITVPFLAIRQIYLGFRAIGCCGGEMPQPERMAAVGLIPRKACAAREMGFSHLALCFGDGRHRVRDALSPLAASGAMIYNEGAGNKPAVAEVARLRPAAVRTGILANSATAVGGAI